MTPTTRERRYLWRTVPVLIAKGLVVLAWMSLLWIAWLVWTTAPDRVLALHPIGVWVVCIAMWADITGNHKKLARHLDSAEDRIRARLTGPKASAAEMDGGLSESDDEHGRMRIVR